MRPGRHLLKGTLLLTLAAGCQQKTTDDPSVTVGADSGDSPPPVYVTLVGHVEDHESLWLCPQWTATRDGLIAWAELIAPYTDTFNLQIDYPFMAAMEDCERPEMRTETDDMNVLRYLESRFGWEFDPHQEGGYEGEDETPDDYADIHWILSRVVESPTDTVGGFIWNDAEQLARYEAGYTSGRLHEHSWMPQLLSMAVHFDHHLSDFSKDNHSSGIWHPAGASEDAFNRHDDDRRLPYIGTGLQHSNWSGSGRCDFNNSIEYAGALANMLARGTLDVDRIYTTSMAFPSSVMLNSDRHGMALEILDAAQKLEAAGQIEIASYTEIHSTWIADYGAEPSVLTYDQVDPSEYTCTD